MNILKLPIVEHAKIHAILSDEKRIELLLRLYDSESGMSFKELREASSLPSGTFNYHLKLLVNSGLVENVLEKRSGTISQYKLTKKGRDLIATLYELLEKGF